VSGPLSSSPIIPGRGLQQVDKDGNLWLPRVRFEGSEIRAIDQGAGGGPSGGGGTAGRCGGLSRGLVAWALAKRAGCGARHRRPHRRGGCVAAGSSR
jgi:hypothetical protein